MPVVRTDGSTLDFDSFWAEAVVASPAANGQKNTLRTLFEYESSITTGLFQYIYNQFYTFGRQLSFNAGTEWRAYGSTLAIDTSAAPTFFVNDHGFVVSESPIRSLLHELLHLLPDPGGSSASGSGFLEDPHSYIAPGRQKSDWLTYSNTTSGSVDDLGPVESRVNQIIPNFTYDNQKSASYYLTGIPFVASNKSLSFGESIEGGLYLGAIDSQYIISGQAIGGLIDRSLQPAKTNLLIGGRGNDTIKGGQGRDFLYGLEGNDVFSDGVGVNFIDGGNWTIGGSGTTEVDTLDYRASVGGRLIDFGTPLGSDGLESAIKNALSPDSKNTLLQGVKIGSNGLTNDIAVDVEFIRLPAQQSAVLLKPDAEGVKGTLKSVSEDGVRLAFDVILRADTAREVHPIFLPGGSVAGGQATGQVKLIAWEQGSAALTPDVVAAEFAATNNTMLIYHGSEDQLRKDLETILQTGIGGAAAWAIIRKIIRSLSKPPSDFPPDQKPPTEAPTQAPARPKVDALLQGDGSDSRFTIAALSDAERQSAGAALRDGVVQISMEGGKDEIVFGSRSNSERGDQTRYLLWTPEVEGGASTSLPAIFGINHSHVLFDGVERVELVDGQDVVYVTDDLFETKEKLLIDGSTAKILVPAQVAGPGVFEPQFLDRGVDRLDFSESPSGVMIGRSISGDGATLFTKWSTGTSSGIFALNMFVTSTTQDGGFTGPVGVRFTNFEKVVGSAHSDSLGLWDLNPGHGKPTEVEEAALAAVTALPATLGSPSAVADAYQAFVTDTLNVGVDTGRLVVEAGAGHDNVQGSRIGYNELHGGSGMDYLYAGGFVSELHGEADSDYVSGGGLKSYLYGGSGADIFNVAANSFVMDATTEDYVTWGPFRLTGGSKQYWMEAGWAYYQPFTAVLQTVGSPAGVGGGLFAFVGNILDTAYGYGFRYATTQGGQLIIQNNLALTGQAIIDQYKGGPGYDFDAARMPGDITVYEQQVTFGRDHNLAAYQALVNLALKAGFGTGIYGTDPLMLDLDGDGLELIRRDLASVYFDLDGDNFAERTAWTRNGDDGFLVRDLNGNGSIDGVAEMFGDATTPGFTALAALDGNADGKITSADAGFSTLRVWRDLNGDGVTDAGELATLAETGITEISVTATQLQNTSIRDSDVRAQATFTRTDGSTSTISDVVLFNSETDTRYLGDTTVSTAAAALPDLRGYGNVTGLRIAMTADATLLGQVTSFAGATGLASWTAVRDQVAGILYRWAGVDGVAATSLGGDFDTRKLAFLETYLGYELAPRNGQGQVQTGNYSELVSSWNDVLDKAAARLAAQGPFAAVFQALTFDTAEDRFAAPAVDTLDDILGAAIATLPTDPTAAAAAWNGLYGPMIAEFMEALVRHDGNATRADFAVKSLLAALEGAASPLSLAQLVTGLGFEGVHIGTAGNDAIVRGTGRDTQIYVGGAGNDTLTGGAGQDVYVFGSGFGIDTIYDAEAGGRDSGDRLRFATLNQSDVTIGRQGFDLVVSVNGSTDKVIVQDYFSTPVMSTSGGQLTEDFGIEDIQFADGTILEAGEVALAVGNGTDQGEVLNGSGIGDYLTAKKGDDTIRGSDGGDNYIYTKDDGHDVIQDVMTNPLLGAPDSLLLLGGIGVEDLHFARDGKGTDLTITFGWSGDSVTIEDQFAYTALGYTSMYAPDNRIEAVSFQFGQSLSWLDLQRLTIATYTTAGNDATYGFGTPDELFASAGNDTLSALDGGDIYHFDQGSGQDVIDDASEFVDTPFSAYLGYTYEADDTLVFGEGIAVADVSFSRLTSAPDLLISFAGLTDTVTVTDQFQGIKLDLFNLLGIGWFGRIENFQFADGTVLTWEDVLGDVTTGKAGNDSLWGAYYADAIEGKAGDDYLSGGDDGDTYVFGAGFGHDTIDDLQTNILTSASDTVLFGAGIGVGDVTFQRDGTTKDLLVTVQGSDTIRIKNQYSVAETGPFGPRAFNEVERFEWADGTVKTFTEISAAIIAAAKTPGADLIVGTHFDDTLDGGAGNDTLIGENGSDTYLINAGDGQDLIADRYDNILADNADRIVFGTGLSASNVTVTRTGGGLADAILTFSSGQSVTIEDQFFYTSINYSPGEIETITFTGGPIWTAADLRATYLAQAQTSGNDTIDGFWTDDSLSASAGNDLLRGGDGSDTYHFGIGAGHDTIEEHVLNVVFEDDDAVVFDGLASSSVTWSRNAGGNDLIAMVNGSDVLTMRDQLTGTFTDIERFVFTDTTLTAAAVSQLLIDGARTTGADVIRGDQLDNTLDGGAGNDTLTGGNGNDSYVFTLGTGQERIDDQNTSVLGSTADRIQFGAGIAFANLSASRVGNDLVITINGTSDSLTIVNQYGAGGRIEAFVFADGSVRTASDVGALSLQSTSGNDTINGTNGDDAIDGGAGNDALAGGEGNDAYAFRRSSGQDTITDGNLNILSSDADSVSFGVGIVRDDLILSRSGNNLVIDIAGSPADRLTIVGQLASASSANGNRIESFQFADGSVVAAGEIEKALLAGTAGSDVLIGFTSNDTLDGGNGSDTLIGGVGDDTYVFGAGYGHDSIDDQNTNILSSEADRITFKAGITPAGVTLQRVGNDLVLTTGAGDQLTVKGQFGVASASRIETFEFADGTVWDWALVNAELLKSTAGADTINGYAGADTIDGGAGNDTLAGKEGDDTYVFDRGYGHDTINDGNLSALTSYADTVVFRSGIGVDDLTFARAGDNLVIGISGTADQLTVVGQFTNVVPDTISSSRIETLVFADGGQLTAAEIDARLLAATAGNDTIVGYNSVEALDGGAGNDTLNGGSGADAYVFGRGYGVDVIEDNALSVLTSDGDRVMFRPDIAPGDLEYSRGGSYLEDLVIRVAGSTDQLTVRNSLTASISDTIETFEFADGTALSIDDIKRILLAGTQEAETLNGFTGSADVLDGKAGNDLLKGDTGSDTYVFARGYGDDIIDDLDGSADVLTFGPLVASTDVTFHRLGSDLAVAIAGTADIVRIAGYYANGFKKIESFVFSDTTLNSAQAEARAVADTLPGVTHQGTPSADVLSGSTGDDAFQGGLGNDTINSAGGNDTFLYASGDGNDIVNETGGAQAQTDTLQLTNLTPDGVSLTRNGNHLLVNVTATSQTVQVTDQFLSTAAYTGIDQLKFADGTTWDRATILANTVIVGTADNDTLNGFATADKFRGLAGNDTINSGAGADTVYYASGDGNDLVNETGGVVGDTDGLQLTDINAASILLTRSANNLLVGITATGQTIQVKDQFLGSAGNPGIDQLAFADGTIWNRSQIGANAWYRGTAGIDSMLGSDLDDTYYGGTGNDSIDSRVGSDTFIYYAGDGNDWINEENSSTVYVDTLKLMDLSAVDIKLSHVGTDLMIDILPTGERVEIDEHFWSTTSNYGIERIEFADGSNWDRSTINANTWYYGTAANNTITGSNFADNIDGDAGNDTISGGVGADFIQGGLGNDSLTGGAGDDVFSFASAFGLDKLNDFKDNATESDIIEFQASAFGSFAEVQAAMTQSSTSVLITHSPGNVLTITNATLANFGADDFRFVT